MGYKAKHAAPRVKRPRKKGGWKKILIPAAALVLAAAIGVGIWFGVRANFQPVGVYAFDNVGMTEYWGDSQESYGPVTTDRIQTVYLSDTQTVTEILVAEGDEVKKGDPLMCFDTTLSELELERKRLEVEKLKIDLDDANRYLWEIRNMTPLQFPDYIPPAPEPDLGETLVPDYQVVKDTREGVAPEDRHDGSSEDKAVICWVRNEYYTTRHISLGLLLDIQKQIREYRAQWGTQEPTAPPETTETVPPETTTESEPPETTETIPPETTTETVPPETTAVTEAKETIAPQEGDDPKSTGGDPENGGPSLAFFGGSRVFPMIPSSASAPLPGDSTEPSETVPAAPEVRVAYVVFKVTQNNRVLADRLLWQGMRIVYDDNGGNISFSFFDAGGLEDYTPTQAEETPPVVDDFDYGGPYTAAQLQKMRREQEKQIQEIDLKVKMAEADYKLMQREVNDGKIYADFDGQVVSLLPEEQARQEKSPLMKVSGGGGFYVSCSVSELEKDNMVIGQEVTVQDWQSGGTYTGEVRSIQDLPSDRDGWSGMGNPNASYYPFTVFVDGEADLQEGRYVNVTFSAGTEEKGIYLRNPFLRTEGGESYVYVRGGDGRLEKRTVTVGKSLWGSYTQVLSGLTKDDYLAFPYGKDIKPGAPTQEGSLEELYNSY